MTPGPPGAALAFAAVLAAVAQQGAGPSPHVDPDAMREAGGEGPATSAEAIAHYLRARKAEGEGDLRGAVAELLSAVAYDGGSPELRTALAEALARSGQPARAEVEARRAVELARGEGFAASRSHLVLAKLSAAARDPVSAARELRLAIDAQAPLLATGAPPDPEPWRLLALLELERGDEPGAWGALEELAAHSPKEGAGFREAGRWLLARAYAGRAERYLSRAVAADRSDLGAWRLLARAHQALGRPPEVEVDLLAILDLESSDPGALHGLGVAALRAGDPGRARPWLERYLRATHDPVEAGAEVSGEWLEAGRSEEALNCARTTRAEAGPDPRLWLAEGLALRRLHRLPEAARVLLKVGKDDGPFPEARVALADVLSRMGRGVDALRTLVVPLRRAPADARLLAAQAGVLVRVGRAPAATKALEVALVNAPTSAPLRLALARAERAAGFPARAEAELRALLALAPEGEPEEAVPLAELAGLMADQGNLPEAEVLARQAAGFSPNSPEALAALGRVLALRGDPAAAMPVLARAADLSGGEASLLDALGDACRDAGRPVEAAAAWRRALAAAAGEPPPEAERLRAAVRRKLRLVKPFLDPRGLRR